MPPLSSEQIKAMRQETFTRAYVLDRAKVDAENRTVEMAFSSEEPYRRYFGIEILGHAAEEVDMEFLSSGRAPLLAGHDHDDQIGVIERAWLDADRKGRAVVRFGKGARADEIFQDVIDGIRANVSVGYRVQEMQLIKSDEEEGETYRVTRWQPLETSIVAVPADLSVGVGRSADQGTIIEVKSMSEKVYQEVETINLDAVKKEALTSERARIREIMALGQQHGFDQLATQAVAKDTTVDQFRAQVLDELSKRGLKPVEVPDAAIGLSEKETRDFSFVRALRALANPTDRRLQEAASFEFEASEAVAKRLQRSAQGVMVPLEVMKRDLTVGTATAGGNLVATNLLAGSFIDLLRNAMMVETMGARMLTGLVGDLAIPRQTGGATSYWVAEGNAPTESAQAFDQVSMTPKTVGAWTDISRKLLKQSSIDIEMFVRSDLATILALAIDSAAINGRGVTTYNEPTGILNTTGIGAVAGGDNGLAPAWSHIVDLWSEVAVDNAAFGATGFLTNSKVVGTLMTVEKATNTAQFVVGNFPDASGITAMAGSRCGVSNQVPSTLDKGTSEGVCSAIIYGNWADLLIGMWGTLDLTVDPYALSTQGAVRVIALQDVDVAVRHPESFAAMQDALTA